MASSDLMGIGELSDSIGARRFSFSNSQDSGFSSVTIDSRNVQDGCLFFALKGQVSDGHNFVAEAFNKGARAAVVEESKLEKYNLIEIAQKAGKELIVVPNSLKGLQDSARVYLEKFPNLIKVGITGSCGKTTTKEIASAIIRSKFNTVMNKGNLNSETGLPLSIFEIRTHHEVGIFELGMNRKGEISEIAFVLKPNIAAVTNVGTAHIENFGSKNAILNEKKCIFNYMQKTDVALIPKNDECAKELALNVKGRVRFYGEDTIEELQDTRSLGLDGTEITLAGEKIHFPLPGKFNLENAYAAIAIANEIPVTNDDIKKGLESVKPLFGRSEILKGRATVVRDCYNANPESMTNSVEFCDSVEYEGRKIYIIGDMLELGTNSLSFHIQIGKLLSRCKADKVFLFGKEIEVAKDYLAAAGKDFYYTQNMDELSSAVDSYIQQGDLVLLKASRGCELERLTDVLLGGKHDS